MAKGKNNNLFLANNYIGSVFALLLTIIVFAVRYIPKSKESKSEGFDE
jgi:hypothetical protein